MAYMKPVDGQLSPGSLASAAEATLRQRAAVFASRAEGNPHPGPAEVATVGHRRSDAPEWTTTRRGSDLQPPIIHL